MQLAGRAFDLTDRSFAGIDRITLLTDDALVTTDDRDLAMRVSGTGSRNDHLVLAGLTLTDSEIAALHRHGIDTVTDRAGDHVNTAPQTSGLDGDRIQGARPEGLASPPGAAQEGVLLEGQGRA